MKTQLTVDPIHGIVLPEKMRKAAGLVPGQRLSVSILPGEIRIKSENIRAKIIQKGKLKVLSGGEIPKIPVDEAVRISRDYYR